MLLLILFSVNNEKVWNNDIALIKLKEDIPLSRTNIDSVLLPNSAKSSSWPPAETHCVVKGWGCTEKGKTDVSTMKKYYFVVLDKSTL